MVIILLATVVVGISFFYYFTKRTCNYWIDRGVKQGKPVWILGDIWKLSLRLIDPAEQIQYLYNQCPGTRYSGFYQFLLPTLLVKDPELIKRIAVKNFDHFVDHRHFVPKGLDAMWDKNLLVLQGKKWRDMRTLLSPSFTSSKLRTMFVLMKECADNVVQHFKQQNKEVVKVDVKDLFTKITNDVIASTSFGFKVNSLEEPKNEFYTKGRELTDIGTIRINFLLFGHLLIPKFGSIFKIPLFTKEISSYFRGLINDSIRIREEKKIQRTDMINLLVQARQEETDSDIDLTNEDIAAQAMIFFFGGFDSASSLMCFTAYELSIHQDIQNKLRKEIFVTLEECGGDLTFDAISTMKYMDMVISESLRKWPNFVSTDRICTKPYVVEAETPEEKPLRIEKGEQIWLPIYAIHHDPKYYPHPERFDPERFSDENKANIKPYTYLPFGLGPRNCIGARFVGVEIKVIFFYLLMHFQLIRVEETDIPPKLSKRTNNLQPDGLTIGLKRIKKE